MVFKTAANMSGLKKSAYLLRYYFSGGLFYLKRNKTLLSVWISKLLMSILSLLATISGGAMALAALPQIYKIFKRKSAKDISAISYSCFAVGGIIWLLYGIELNSSAVIISNTLSTITAILVLIGWFLYGRASR